MKTPPYVSRIIGQLSGDIRVIGQCPQCEEKAPLRDWNLFYMDNLPQEAKAFVLEQKQRIKELADDLNESRSKATTQASKKSLEVNIGKVLERMVPALESFPYHRYDCRGLFDPVDYIIFSGYSKLGRVEEIHFAEVKTGNAQLNDHQEMVRRAVEKGRVAFGVY